MAAVIVVGGSTGTGRVLAIRLAHAGQNVSIVSRKPGQTLGDAANRITHWHADLSQSEDIERITKHDTERWGSASALVLCQRNRGQNSGWNEEFRVSLEASRAFIEAFADSRNKGQGGSIVAMTSVASHYVAVEQPVEYNAAKAALAQMVRYYAAALAPHGIRVNAVAPAAVLKPETSRYYLKDERRMEMYRRAIPLGAIPTSEDVCGVIEFLLSDAAAMVTGQEIVVDGGLSLLTHEGLARKMWKE